jgi:hypothetical protein
MINSYMNITCLTKWVSGSDTIITLKITKNSWITWHDLTCLKNPE